MLGSRSGDLRRPEARPSGVAGVRSCSTFRLQASGPSAASLSATSRPEASMIQKPPRYFSLPTWVGLGHTAGTGRSSGASPTSHARVGRGRFVLPAARGPVDLDRYPLRGGPPRDQVERPVPAGVGEQPRTLAEY